MFSALTLYGVGAFSCFLGAFSRCFGLRKFWGEFCDCCFDIFGTVFRCDLVPVVQVRHHAAHDFEAVSLQRPPHVAEVLDAALGGV